MATALSSSSLFAIHSASCSATSPSMRCSSCGHTFCFTHGDSHPGKSCSQWARDNLQSEKETERAIKSFTKMCPGCRVATQKSAGCNHMKCSQCKTEWRVAPSSMLCRYPFLGRFQNSPHSLAGAGYAPALSSPVAPTPRIMQNGTYSAALGHSSLTQDPPEAHVPSCCTCCYHR